MLQERELAVHKVIFFLLDLCHLNRTVQRLNGIPATVRESQAPEDTPERLEEERVAAQEFIDNGAWFEV